MPDPLTIMILVIVIAALWILFKILLGMAASIFRFGCFIIFFIAIGMLVWNVFIT